MIKGEKHDEGKPRFDLIDPEFELLLARVLTKGAETYGDNTWQDLEDAEHRYLAACRRHINKFSRGEILDRDSGLPHVVHAACNLMFLNWKENNNEVTDIRRHTDRDTKGDDEARGASTNGNGPNYEHKYRVLEGVISPILEVLGSSETHKSARARVVQLLDLRGFSQFTSPTDSSSDE